MTLPTETAGTLAGQVVVVTGGSRGIGRSIVRRLAREGPAHVVVGYASNYTAAREAASELDALGVGASIVALDVAREEMLRDLFQSVAQRHGRLDVFVSNAARTSFRPAMELSRRSWQRIIDINATAFLTATQLAAPIMRDSGGGRIIGISSLGSRYYVPAYAGLGAAKAVIEALTRYLAVELAAWDVNVNVVCAGFVDTESMRLAPEYDALVDHLVANTPAGRIATPEDVAGIVAFLCSAESDWIRGQTLVADGGYSLSLGHGRR